MKKLLSTLSTIALLSTTAANTVSCLRHTPSSDNSDFDWSVTNKYDKESRTTSILSDKTNESQTEITPENIGKSIDYVSGFNTGYKTQTDIKMQGTTGVPLSNRADLTGNVMSDFGDKSQNAAYTRINQILNWSPETDMDAKYNKSVVPLQKRKATGEKWTATQDAQIKFMDMGRMYSGRFNGVDGNNTVTGQQKIYQENLSNWQYIDTYVWWQGPVGCPPGEFTDYAHKNGAKSYGLIYLDGFYGLKAGQIQDLITQDSSGHYPIVDILIKMARYYGFDGWFLNEEANGSFAAEQPVLKYQEMTEILRQFKEAADAEAKESNGQNKIEMMGYTDHSNLQGSMENGDWKPQSEKTYNYSENSDSYLSDFGEAAITNQGYVENGDSRAHTQGSDVDSSSIAAKSGTKTDYDIYNMIDWGSDRDGQGTFQGAASANWQELVLNSNGQAINSFGMFGSQADWESAGDTSKFTPQSSDEIGSDIQRMQEEFRLESLMYAGNDKSPRGSWYTKALTNDEAANEANQSKSFGVANLKQEETTLIDGMESFKTNFSVGEGKIWIDENTHQNVTNNDKYTWYNRGLADVQPTYKWDIFDDADKSQAITGGVYANYDFDEAYEKGNSIALGSEPYNDASNKNTAGSISAVKLDQTTDWNIMGANIDQGGKYKISLTYKATGTDAKDKVKLLVNESTEEAESTDAGNGWTTLTYTPSGEVNKIGIQVAESSNIKVNVGQIKLDKVSGDKKAADNSNVITNMNSEYTVIRDSGKFNTRLDWDVTDDKANKVDYYEVYYELNGKMYRYGETNHNNYWLGDINIDTKALDDFKIYIRPIINGADNSNYEEFDINIKGWK
jgi:endo-beta-N-acetylglucosaminidase D